MTANVSPKTPLIFISHDSRDAELAEAFSKLLTNVSAGVLKSFRSSDRKGSQGIEYGAPWYLKLLSNLKSASDVVCLLTQRSLDRPWILYEAGFAKGRSTTVHGVALGIPVNQASAGPFAEFQNCEDDEDSLTKLVTQLVRRIPGSEPDRHTIRKEVRAFKKRATTNLRKRKSLPDALQKLERNWKRYAQLHPDQPNLERFKLYSFCGITDEHESEEAFADLEDVYFLWADAGVGSSIKAQVLRKGEKRIRVRFNNEEGAHASNVAFRLRGRNLLYKEAGFEQLKFSARIPPEIEEGHLKEVQLGIRIIDALKTHWIYAGPGGYRSLFVPYKKGK